MTNTWVFVHAHPDDETLWTGGLLATLCMWGECSALNDCRCGGGDCLSPQPCVIVVTCTRGERGEVITAPGTATENLGHLAGDHAALAEYRVGELRNALNVLRAHHPYFEHYFLDELPWDAKNWQRTEFRLPQVVSGLIDPRPDISVNVAEHMRYEDSGMVWLVEPSLNATSGTSTGGIAGPVPGAIAGFANGNLNEQADRLAALIRNIQTGPQPIQPEHNGRTFNDTLPHGDDGIVIVTYEADGGYGHPDHVRAHDIAVAAIEKVIADDRVAAEATHQIPSAPVRSLETTGSNLELWEVTKPGEPYEFAVSLTSALVGDVLLEAMRAYPSQVQNVQRNDGDAEGLVGWFELSSGVPIPIRDHETYRVTKY